MPLKKMAGFTATYLQIAVTVPTASMKDSRGRILLTVLNENPDSSVKRLAESYKIWGQVKVIPLPHALPHRMTGMP